MSTPTNTVPGPASAISTTSHFTACRHKQAPCARPTLERHKIQTGQDALSEKKTDLIWSVLGIRGAGTGRGLYSVWDSDPRAPLLVYAIFLHGRFFFDFRKVLHFNIFLVRYPSRTWGTSRLMIILRRSLTIDWILGILLLHLLSDNKQRLYQSYLSHIYTKRETRTNGLKHGRFIIRLVFLPRHPLWFRRWNLATSIDYYEHNITAS